MPTFYNVSQSHATPIRTVRVTKDGESIMRYVGPGVPPGEAHEFSDEEAAHLGWEWSDVDPRAGLVEEREFKRRRDATPVEDASPESTEAPAESGENEGETA